MKTKQYIELQEGIADIVSALPELFDHPAHAAHGLACAFGMHCRLWGITDDQAHDLIAAALAEYRTPKH